MNVIYVSTIVSGGGIALLISAKFLIGKFFAKSLGQAATNSVLPQQGGQVAQLNQSSQLVNHSNLSQSYQIDEHNNLLRTLAQPTVL